MDRRHLLGGACAFAALSVVARQAGAAPSGAAEKPRVSLGVGGKSSLYYLPLTIADRKGFFGEEGLQVAISDFAGGAKSLQALIGGSVDVVTGSYEHTIRMQAKGQAIEAVCELGRFPGFVIAVRKSESERITSAADFKGRRIGVTAPGSSTAILVQYLMVKAGLKPTDASFISVGSGPGAVAAMQQGEIDVMCNSDPMMVKLKSLDLVRTLYDTRTEAGTRAVYGGPNPAAVVYLKREFIDANPNTTQRLVNAHLKALTWLAKATPEQVVDTVPSEYLLGDRQLYLESVRNSLELYSRTGIVPRDGMESVLDTLKTVDKELSDVKIDLTATFTDRFVKAASS